MSPASRATRATRAGGARASDTDAGDSNAREGPSSGVVGSAARKRASAVSERNANESGAHSGEDDVESSVDADDNDGDDDAREVELHGAPMNVQTGRLGPPIKAAPLLDGDILGLGDDERRRVLARWSGRLRGIKRRALDLGRQFPTSSVLVYFTKPFPAAKREGMWAEEELEMLGPLSRVERPSPEGRLSGAQIIRRTLADLSQTTLSESDRRRDALRGSETTTVSDVNDFGAGTNDTRGILDSLYEAIAPHVSEHSRGAVAHAFVSSRIKDVLEPIRGGELEKQATNYADGRRRERDAAISAALDDARRIMVSRD